MKILVAHPGTQHAHHLVTGLIANGHDVKYSTIMTFGDQSPWKALIPSGAFNKRLIKSIDDKFIDRHSFLEIVPPLLQRMGTTPQAAYAKRNRMFQNRISEKEIQSYSAVVGFDTSSVILERKAEKTGTPFFLELTQVHPKEKIKWSSFIKEKYPQWPIALLYKSEDLIQEENEELERATIVSAPASYVKQTYSQHCVTKNEIVINPFGADVVEFTPKRSYRRKRPVFVFMAAISPVKGVPVLLDAWKLAKPDAELVIGGHGEWPEGVEIPEGVRVIGRVHKHQREEYLHSGDVFLCPSLYEGLALTQLEAAACGLAVIGTHNSGGSEFLREGQEGFFVPPGNATALAEKISYFAEHPEECERMGKGAAIRAQEYTWHAYATRWSNVITRQVTKKA